MKAADQITHAEATQIILSGERVVVRETAGRPAWAPESWGLVSTPEFFDINPAGATFFRYNPAWSPIYRMEA